MRYLTVRSLLLISAAMLPGMNDDSLLFDDGTWVGDIVLAWWMMSWRWRKSKRAVSRLHFDIFCRIFRISPTRFESRPEIDVVFSSISLATLPGSFITLNMALVCSAGINCSGNSLRNRLSRLTAKAGVNGCFRAFSRSAGCLIFTGSCR